MWTTYVALKSSYRHFPAAKKWRVGIGPPPPRSHVTKSTTTAATSHKNGSKTEVTLCVCFGQTADFARPSSLLLTKSWRKLRRNTRGRGDRPFFPIEQRRTQMKSGPNIPASTDVTTACRITAESTRGRNIKLLLYLD